MRKLISILLVALLLASAIPAFAEEAQKPVILIVSFGTSYNDTRAVTIDAIEKQAQEAFPDYEVRRAFTSQTIINKLNERDGLTIDNVMQAMDRLVADGVKQLVVQPTHVMNGFEYDDMMAEITPYEGQFESVKYGKPLLTSAEDYTALVAAMAAEFPETGEKDAIVLMGHGTHHYANATYASLDYTFKHQGMKNVFVGTVESYPDLDTVLADVKDFAPEKVYLLPVMIVAGDHASNDMAGDEEGSWKLAFKGEGYDVECILKGLGEYQGVRDQFIQHIHSAIAGEATEEEAGE